MKTNTSGFLKISTSRAIYPGSRKGCYVGLLSCSKLLRTLALFLAYDILQFTNVVQFLFIVKLFASLCLLVIQKPFSSGKRLSKPQWIRVVQHGFFNSLVSVLWLLGLARAGPLRAVLLFEHNHVVVAAAVAALCSGIGGPSKIRGAICIIIAAIVLLLFDDDGAEQLPDNPGGLQESNQMVQYITSWTGVADHKGGVLLLVIAVSLQKCCEAIGRRLSVEVGGAKRLNAMSTLACALTLAPWAFFTRFTQQEAPNSWLQLVVPLACVAVVLFVIDYYVDSICFLKLDVTMAIRNSSIPMFLFAALLTLHWKCLYPLPGVTYESHRLSAGVIFASCATLIATYLLSSPSSRQLSKGTLIGYSESGEPIYSSQGDATRESSCLDSLRHGVKSVFEDADSRRIFYFLCLNLAYTFVELIYGIWTNSLGLIADGFHMLFDCSALVMGLCAALMSKWKATPTFSFGYGRVDALSGFVNGLFLVVVSGFVCSTALTRLWDPPEIISGKLLPVSIAGLCVNFVGILTFLRPKSTAQTRDSRHGHGHGHGHSHSIGHHGHSHNANMEGVFLHVLADTMGSLGVIVSSVLIENFGWLVADPICSLFISLLIFLSVLPLLWHSTQVLLLRVPISIEKKLAAAVLKVVSLEGVVSYRNLHVWQHSSDVFAGSIHVHVTKESMEQRVVSQVTTIFRDLGVNIFTVQVEKDDFFHHLSGLSSSVSSSRALQMNNDTNFPTALSTVVKAV